MNIIECLKNKRILIWGYGKEGKSTEAFLKRYSVTDMVDIYEGKKSGIDENKYDVIIKSPGIAIDEYNPKYTSQTELFMNQFRENIIGITGTKGKSTTSAMLYNVLKNCTDKNVILLGNIGYPCLDYYEEITDDTIIVFELSCHQLAHIKISPHIAVILNIYEEHLDYYQTYKKYKQAKFNITKYQKNKDYLIIGENIPERKTKAIKYRIYPPLKNKFEMSILGVQNQYNAEIVYQITTKIFNCNEIKVKKALSEFIGLPHRLEKINVIDDVTFYDDSIATIPEATIYAIESIENIKTILIGGMDRGIDYSILIKYIKTHPEFFYIFSYASGKRIYSELKSLENCFYAENLKESTNLARKITPKGKACVLSPAAPSYGYFKNFEERGSKFLKYLLEN